MSRTCTSCDAANPSELLYCRSCWAPLSPPARTKVAMAATPERREAPDGSAVATSAAQPLEAARAPAGYCSSCGVLNGPSQLYCVECWAPLVQAPVYGATSQPSMAEAAPRTVTPSPPALWAPYANRDLALARAGVTLAFSTAVFVRFFRLGDVPPGLLQAETVFRQAAAAVLEQQSTVRFWTELTNGQPPGVAYILAGWTAALGDGAQEMRLLSAFAGLVTIGLLFLLCRGLFGFRTAVAASLLLAFSVWHLSYSRLSLPVVWLPLVEIIAIYALFQALEEQVDTGRQRRLLMLAGAALGSGVYYHNAFLIFVAAVLALWARELLAGEQPLSVVLKRAALFFAAAAAVALPFLGFLASNPSGAAGELRAVAVSSTPEYRELGGVMEESRYVMGRIRGRVGTLLWRSGDDGEDRGSTRLLDPLTASLAAIGLLAALRRWRERNYAFLLLLAAAAIVAAGLTGDAGAYARLIVAAPAVFAAAGIALNGILQSMRGRVPDLVAVAAVAVLLSFVALHNINSLYSHPSSGNEALWSQIGAGAIE